MSNKPKTKVLLLQADRSDRLTSSPPLHGALKLPAVRVDSYNLDIVHAGRRLAAYTNKRALKAALDKWRKAARLSGSDPFGKRDSAKITKKELDAALASEDCQARCILAGTVEDFAGSLALLTEHFLQVPEWRHTERIVVGGGLRASATGELIIRRAQALLHDRGRKIDLSPIRSQPHEAALLGSAHLVPAGLLEAYDAMIAADIGGTNARVGVVRLGSKMSETKVWKKIVWRHADHGMGRDDIVRTIASMMRKLIRKTRAKGLRLAPAIGVACPGLISADGSIGTGSELLPGNWRSLHFNLPSRLSEAIPSIGDRKTVVVLHNDAVAQGLSEIPYLGSCRRWGVFTVGTGLGNAHFTRA